ncbi:MAG TPA: sodium:solute symporter family protein [Candidatus Nanoarchaeia archaeon]|nr:sodium:solute symporter family protein [Candidatus Nanoarchaeia archaeon]
MILTILFFLVYLAIVLAIGILSSRKVSEEGFMMAERNVQGAQVAATMSAGFFDGATLAIYLAYVYQYGFSAIWLFIGLAIGFLFLRKYAWKIKQKANQMKVYSMPEYFFRVLGKRNGLMFSFLLVLQFFLFLIVNLVISGKVLAAIFPIPYPLAVMIGGIIILTYLLLAGFKAVVRTDFFQLIIMFIMSLSVGLFLFGKTHIPASEFNMGTLGLGNILGFLILSGFGVMVAPDLWQRIFATKDEKNLKKGLAYAVLILPILAILISVVGLATKQSFPNILAENALVTGFSHLLPFGLKEFGMVLLYAVALSSSDTITFVVSSIFTRDLKNYSKKYTDEPMKKLTRFFMIIFIFLAAIISIFYQNIMDLGFSLASLNLSLFPVVFGSLYWKLKEKAVFWSLTLAFISVLILFLGGYLNPETAIISLPVALVSLMLFQKIFNKEKSPRPS